MANGREIEYCALTLHQLWASGASYAEIAAALGCSQSHIHHLKVRHKLSNRQRPTKEIFEDDPTPEQIAERAAECRARRDPPPTPKTERVNVAKYSWDGFRFHAIG